VYRISCSAYVRTFSTLPGIRPVFWISSQLNIFGKNAMKLHYAKNDNSAFTCSLPRTKLIEAGNFPASGSYLNPVDFSFWELCSKIVWNAFCYYYAGPDDSGLDKRDSRSTMFKAHDKHVEFLLTHGCSLMSIVNFGVIDIFGAVWFLWSCAKKILKWWHSRYSSYSG